MTLGLYSIGAYTDLLDADASAFAYAPRRTLEPLLPYDLGQSELGLIQEGAKTYRQATFRFYARDTAELEGVRGYEETGETVAFVDLTGASRQVMVFEFSATLAFGDIWEVALTLLELNEPTPPGS